MSLRVAMTGRPMALSKWLPPGMFTCFAGARECGVAMSGQGRAVEVAPGTVDVPRGDPRPLASLLDAKTARPLMVRAAVVRQRLFDLLDQATLNPVTVVRAGAGWGKTVLASAWAQTRAGP